MDNLSITDKFFFEKNDLNKENIIKVINEGLVGCDDGELFLEYCQNENITFDDGHIRGSSFEIQKVLVLEHYAEKLLAILTLLILMKNLSLMP